jgi:hypothetical protein
MTKELWFNFGKEISPHKSIQTTPEAQPALYSVGTLGKVAEPWNQPLTIQYHGFECVEVYFHPSLPPVSFVCGA